MIIDASNFIDGETKEVSFSENILIPGNYCVDNNADVKVTGEISNEKGKFHFIGKVFANLCLNCDLCLKPFDIELKFTVDEFFSDDFSEDDSENDFFHFSDKKINLAEAVISGILLNIPMKAVCSDNCKGLCDICGYNLNDGDCGCDKTCVNPKFEKLKALFEESEEEV